MKVEMYDDIIEIIESVVKEDGPRSGFELVEVVGGYYGDDGERLDISALMVKGNDRCILPYTLGTVDSNSGYYQITNRPDPDSTNTSYTWNNETVCDCRGL